MGINLGAFLAPLVCGYLGQRVNWHLGFAAAGVGMVLGLVQYVARRPLPGRRRRCSRRRRARPKRPRPAGARRSRRSVGALIAVGAARRRASRRALRQRHRRRRSPSAVGYVAARRTVVFFGWLFLVGDWTPEERSGSTSIGVFFLAAALFWSVFEQAGSTLNLFADRSTRTTSSSAGVPEQLVPVGERALHHHLRAGVRLALGHARPARAGQPDEVRARPDRRRARLPGARARGARRRAAARHVSPMWLTTTYLIHTFAELCLSPVGLSSMTKLAPARIAGLMMGVWFLGASVGNFIGGQLAGVLRSDAARRAVRRRQRLADRGRHRHAAPVAQVHGDDGRSQMILRISDCRFKI